MKPIFMTMAAVSVLGLAVPAAGQPWSGSRPQSDEIQSRIEAGVRSGAITRGEAMPLRDGLRHLIALERRFGPNGYTGRENSALSRRSALLRRQIGMAERTDASHGRRAGWRDDGDDDGRAGWNPRGRSRPGSGKRDDVERDTRWEDRADAGRDSSWDQRSGNRAGSGRDEIARYALWNTGSADRKPLGRDMSRFDDRFDRANRGDRFVGDVRAGQAASVRMTELPERYRARFADDERVYHRYDDRRIYQVDRRNGLVLGLLDMID